MNLVTPKRYPINIAYIDDYGYISSKQFNVECFINTLGDDSDVWNGLIKEYNQLLIINGYSEFSVANAFELKTPNININTTSGVLKYHKPMMPYLGSIKECIEKSLAAEACTILSQVANNYSNCYVKITDEVPNTFNIVSMTKLGIQTVYGVLEHTFAPDRSMTCEVCNRGYQTYETLKSHMSKSILFSNSILGQDISISGQGVLEATFNLEDDKDITQNLYNSLYPAIYDAKIASLEFRRN